MIKNDMRNPIIKTVLLLAATTLIILFSFNAPPGSGILGTLIAVVSGIFTTFKVIIGLLAAFVISFFLFIVIFSLSVAIISRTDAVNVINSVVSRIIGKDIVPQPRSHVAKEAAASSREVPVAKQETGDEKTLDEKSVERVKEKMRDYLDSNLKPLQKAKDNLADEISSLYSRLSNLAEEIKETKTDQRVDGIEENIAELRSDLITLQQGVDEIRQEIEGVRGQLQEAVSAKKRKKEAEKTDSPKEPEGEHRIFEYLTRKADRRKFAELTAKTVEQGMSYTEATSFIVSNMPDEAAGIVEAHPALTREYIKSCREAVG